MNFILDNIFLVCVALFSAGSLIWPYIRPSSKISQLDATNMINKGKVALIDVRDLSEFRAGHLRNAIHVPLAELKDRLPKLEKFKSQPLILIDKDGKQATGAVSQLKAGGFKEVYNLEGGMDFWILKGKPTTK